MNAPRLRRLRSGTLAVVRLRAARLRLLVRVLEPAPGRLVATLRRLADHLDPPARVVERAVVADGIAQGRADLQYVHGTGLLVLSAPAGDLVAVHLRPDGWVACTLGAITATRPLGSLVRLTAREGRWEGERIQGCLDFLRPSDLSPVLYEVGIVQADGGRPLDLTLPLSHPIEVRRPDPGRC